MKERQVTDGEHIQGTERAADHPIRCGRWEAEERPAGQGSQRAAEVARGHVEAIVAAVKVG